MYKLVFKAWQYYVLYTIVKLQVVRMFMYMCECKYILFIKYCKKAREKECMTVRYMRVTVWRYHVETKNCDKFIYKVWINFYSRVKKQFAFVYKLMLFQFHPVTRSVRWPPFLLRTPLLVMVCLNDFIYTYITIWYLCTGYNYTQVTLQHEKMGRFGRAVTHLTCIEEVPPWNLSQTTR